MWPWIMQACYATAPSRLGVARTHSMLELFYWWISMNISTRWWLRHCLQRQPRKSFGRTARWPVLSLPLPSGPGSATSVDYFAPLLVLPKGNSYIHSPFHRPFQPPQTYTPFLRPNSRPRTPPTFWGARASLYGGAQLVSTPTTDSNFSPSCFTRFTSYTACAKLQQGPIILTATAASSA